MWGAGVTMDKSQGWGQQAAIDCRIKERNWWVGQIISYYLNWGNNYYFLSSEFGETMPDSAEGQWEIFSDTVAANIFSGKVEPGRRRTEKQLNIPWKPPFCINVGAPTCFNIQPPWLKIWHKNFVYKVYITHLNIELTMIKLNNAIYDQPKTNPGSVWFSIGCKLSKVDNRLAEETKSVFQLSKNLPTLHEKDPGLVYMQLAHRSGKTGLSPNRIFYEY